MPIIFVHGVNVRKDAAYHKNLAARNELIKRLLLKPLGFENASIASPYWGGHGVNFAWGRKTLPDVKFLESLGGEELIVNSTETPLSDLTLSAMLDESAAAQPGTGLESLGAGESRYKQAALSDLPRFLEAILAPVILSENSLALKGSEAPEEVGKREAALLIAAHIVAQDPATKAALQQAASDNQVIEVLKTRVLEEFEKQVPTEQPISSGLEALGASDIFNTIKDRVGEVFNRTLGAPGRVASVAAMDLFRQALNNVLTPFMGDVFVYLNKRGKSNAPGPIVLEVMKDIVGTPTQTPNEPLIVMTHSMGGNVFYDILTSFMPHLKVDAWISVGGQVGLFEEMKLFQASSEGIKEPARVAMPADRLKFWLNVYDPADVLSFRASPVFDMVQDEPYRTGTNTIEAHSAYFLRPSFYDMVCNKVKGIFG
jgi:hypothetical protein